MPKSVWNWPGTSSDVRRRFLCFAVWPYKLSFTFLFIVYRLFYRGTERDVIRWTLVIKVILYPEKITKNFERHRKFEIYTNLPFRVTTCAVLSAKGDDWFFLASKKKKTKNHVGNYDIVVFGSRTNLERYVFNTDERLYNALLPAFCLLLIGIEDVYGDWIFWQDDIILFPVRSRFLRRSATKFRFPEVFPRGGGGNFTSGRPGL